MEYAPQTHCVQAPYGKESLDRRAHATTTTVVAADCGTAHRVAEAPPRFTTVEMDSHGGSVCHGR